MTQEQQTVTANVTAVAEAINKARYFDESGSLIGMPYIPLDEETPPVRAYTNRLALAAIDAVAKLSPAQPQDAAPAAREVAALKTVMLIQARELMRVAPQGQTPDDLSEAMAHLRSLSPAQVAPVDGGGITVERVRKRLETALKADRSLVSSEELASSFEAEIASAVEELASTTPASAGDGDLRADILGALRKAKEVLTAVVTRKGMGTLASRANVATWQVQAAIDALTPTHTAALSRPAPQAPAASSGGGDTPPICDALDTREYDRVPRAALAPTAKPEPAGRDGLERALCSFVQHTDRTRARHGGKGFDAIDWSRREEVIDAILAARPVAEGVAGEERVIRSAFARGARVRKISGSSWQGTVRGHYSTDLTPDGVCVESEREPGSVQLYPTKALTIATAPATQSEGEQ